MKIGKFDFDPKRIAIFIGIAFLVLLVMDFNSRLEGLYKLQKQAEQVEYRATEVMSTNYNLQTAVAYATSDLAVQEWAREQASMALPGEKVIVPLPEPGVTPPAPIIPPALQPTPLSNWDKWMIVIFGD
jgi:hypothetical protein